MSNGFSLYAALICCVHRGLVDDWDRQQRYWPFNIYLLCSRERKKNVINKMCKNKKKQKNKIFHLIKDVKKCNFFFLVQIVLAHANTRKLFILIWMRTRKTKWTLAKLKANRGKTFICATLPRFLNEFVFFFFSFTNNLHVVYVCKRIFCNLEKKKKHNKSNGN